MPFRTRSVLLDHVAEHDHGPPVFVGFHGEALFLDGDGDQGGQVLADVAVLLRQFLFLVDELDAAQAAVLVQQRHADQVARHKAGLLVHLG